ncbi:BREX-1 system adenine-specific DNA-methyltransferase PglX [Chlorobium phaeovibrioides]|uniref:site-specific DNA-methyltransferase (adenine-specific) n=1 Tax=Chlorobium phaeovibrioides TaxID=1094 RepID=A0A5M8IBN2_CHLPH|nr:BREX-1 system adenine-specific DNA-methyltransferase PglX [Chlorobium phaeovibrioides]KAA6232803.1 BREX-1 system adenine-specific DNA-methyltransferase PglX [Chlorobium phaeovibrioides]
METLKLKRFAQYARRSLLEQVSAKLKLVLAENSAARRERAEAIKKLEEAIKGHGKEQVIERVAYIWFNRFCALRFMDVNRYNRVNIVSPADPGQFQPEILAEAKMGHIDEEMVDDKIRQQIFALLNGKAPSHDPQGEAYRLLVVAACNFWNKAMPFLFQRIDDYTELLMPDDLLSGNSILAYTREAMTPDACKDVEVIGWLYQFYISEKKDEVFDGLKKNKKITPENIPAATQLFTPHWIVRYLVENSLGRLWLLNRPGSKLVLQMDYYIKPEQPARDFLRIGKPEEIKICDPACGSGHMLTYAFDLLYAIYEEEGVDPAEIPEKILNHNLYGIEIDERAGELAAFALTMKARAKQRRFFNKGVKPNICVLENVHFDGNELKDYMDFVGRDLFNASLQTTLREFEEADNFGSLIRPDVTDVDGMLRILESKNVSGQLFLSMTHQKVLQALRQADYLSPKYHVVIANPPYMGGKGMNGRLAAWVKDNYPNSKSDLFAMFIERNLDLAQKHGAVAMITMQSWMFLSSFEALRARLLGQSTLLSMAHLGARAFDSIGGEVVSTTAFVLENSNGLNYKGGYLRLVAGNSEAEKNDAIREAVKNPDCGWFYCASAADFKKIPGSPIAYWASAKLVETFQHPKAQEIATLFQGIITGDNERLVRGWQEISLKRVSLT